MKRYLLLMLLIFFYSVACRGQGGEWIWANRSFRGGGNEGVSTCTDKEGNVFVAGVLIKEMITGSIDLNPGYNNDRDIFVVKYDSSGNAIWGKRFGGHDGDVISAITINIDDGVYIAGYFKSDTIKFDNIILINPKPSSSVFMNFFIAKLDLNGNVVWVKKAIGDGSCHDCDTAGGDLVSDSNGHVYATGTFESSSMTFDGITINQDFTVGLDGCWTPYSSFIAKYDANGNALWAKTLMGSPHPPGIAINSVGEIYLSGTSLCSGWAIGNITLQNPGAVLVKLDTEGNTLWAKGFGDKPVSVQSGFPLESRAWSIAIDQFDNCYIVGDFYDTLHVGGITLYTSPPAGSTTVQYSIFTAKFDPNGNALWAKISSRSGGGISSAIAVNKSGNVFITGYLYFPVTTINQSICFGNINLKYLKINDDEINAYVAHYDNNGNLLWAYLVDAKSGGNDITSFSDDVYITGTLNFNPYEINNRPIYFGDKELPPSTFTEGVYSQFSQSSAMFIAKLKPCHESVTSLNTIVSVCPGDSITLTPNSLTNGIWSTGEISSSITVKSPGFYSIPIYNSKGCLTNIETTTVTLRTLEKVVINRAASFCPGDSITLSSTSLTNNVWSTGEISPTITVKSPDVYSVSTLNLKDCAIIIETTTVTLYAFPKATVTVASLRICEGQYEELVSTEATAYLWNTGATSQSIFANRAGSYYVNITDSNGCRGFSQVVELNYIDPLPDIDLLSDCHRIFINLDLHVIWFQNGEIIKLDSTLKKFYPSDSGFYHVEASNKCGAKKSNTIHFIPSDPHFLTLPNVITPNGDGYNDLFVLDRKLSGSALVVVNRWGKEVYYSEEYLNNWSGDDLSSGSYYYVISNSCFAEKLKGIITIVR